MGTGENEQPIVLTEHAETEIAVDQEVARALASDKRAKVSVSPSAKGWLVKPSQMVGVVSAAGQQVIIRPKIGMANLLGLLDVSPAQLHWLHDRFQYDDEPDLLVALIRLFRRGLDIALAQGLRLDYRHEEDRLLSVRGRIDIAATIRRPGTMVPIPCRYDEYTGDVRLNRLLLAGIQRCTRVQGVPHEDRIRLRRHLQAFEGVLPMDESLDWVDHWVPSRLERHYEAAVRTAAMILRNTTAVDRPGAQTATSFLVDMNKLVEKFIEDRLASFLEGRLQVDGQQVLRLDTNDRIPIKPDLVFKRERRPVFVADVKYKVFDELTGDNTSDLYQLHTYAQVQGLSSGALISCVTEEQRGPVTDRITVRESGVTLHLWPIDLRGSLAGIEAEILRLADMIAIESSQESQVQATPR